MVRYVASGIVFGYVGWGGRRTDVDRALERHLRDELHWDLDATVEWLISRDGRGFGDAFSGMETIRDYQYFHPSTWDALEGAPHSVPCETTGTEAG